MSTAPPNLLLATDGDAPTPPPSAQCPVPSASGPLPSLSPADAALIDAFVEANADLRATAIATGTPMRHLGPWSLQPHIAPWIAFLTLHQARHVRATTITYLQTITAAPLNPIEGRRAANSILRHLHTPLPGSPEARYAPPRRRPRRPIPGAAGRARVAASEPGATGRSRLEASDQCAPSASSGAPSGPHPDRQDPGPGTQDGTPPTPPTVHWPTIPSRAQLFAPTTPGDALIPIAPTDFIPHPDHPIEHVAAHVLASLVEPNHPTPQIAAANLHNFHRNAYAIRDADAPSRTIAWLKQKTPHAFNIADCAPGPIQRGLNPDWRHQECSIHTRDAAEAPAQHLTLRLDFCRGIDFSWMLAQVTTREPGIPHDPYLPDHATWDWYNQHRRRR